LHRVRGARRRSVEDWPNLPFIAQATTHPSCT
jgi:hypothetical protein